MEIKQKTVLVAGIDVAEDRFEGEIFIFDNGDWARVGYFKRNPAIVKLTPDTPSPIPTRVVVAPSHRASSRPWLGRKKGRAAH